MSDAMPHSSQGSHQSPLHKAAKLAVIILSGLIILALIGLVAGAMMKLAGKSKAREVSSVFALPPGAKIVSMDSQPGRLILRIRSIAGEEIDILDTANGHLVGQVQTTPGK